MGGNYDCVIYFSDLVASLTLLVFQKMVLRGILDLQKTNNSLNSGNSKVGIILVTT